MILLLSRELCKYFMKMKILMHLLINLFIIVNILPRVLFLVSFLKTCLLLKRRALEPFGKGRCSTFTGSRSLLGFKEGV
jgi:hypothetical protein